MQHLKGDWGNSARVGKLISVKQLTLNFLKRALSEISDLESLLHLDEWYLCTEKILRIYGCMSECIISRKLMYWEIMRWW